MSATTSVRIMSGLMITHKSECRKAQEKSGEMGGVKKGGFWRGRRRGQKWGNGLEQGGRRGVKKFLGDEHGEVEWGGVKF